MYSNGEGVEKNMEKAIELYLEGHKQGNNDATEWLNNQGLL